MRNNKPKNVVEVWHATIGSRKLFSKKNVANSPAMVSRNQRKEKDENITQNMDNEDKCLTADVNKEASDEDGVRGDEETSLIV